MPLKTDTIEEPNLNLTPMIDVVFLLIIFFMVGTQFTQPERQYDVKLPTVANAPPLTSLPDEITINVRQNGEIVVRNQVLTPEELEAELTRAKQNFAEQAVVIRGDAGGKYQHVMTVLAICNKVDIASVSLANQIQEPRE